MTNKETEQMLRLGKNFRQSCDNKKSWQNLSYATLTMENGMDVEAIGHFDQNGNYIAYLAFNRDSCGMCFFYVKTDTEHNHSAQAKRVVIIECKGFFFEKQYIKEADYDVLDGTCCAEIDEQIYDHSQMIGCMMQDEGYSYDMEHKRFVRNGSTDGDSLADVMNVSSLDF